MPSTGEKLNQYHFTGESVTGVASQTHNLCINFVYIVNDHFQLAPY